MKEKLKEQLKRLRQMPKWQRVSIGLLLIVGGILGALPVLGFWMIPLGLAILAIDYPWARRANVRLKHWIKSLRKRFSPRQ